MTLILISDSELHLSFDPTGIEERIPSVGFDVVADFSMPFQQTTLRIKDCWFTHEALRSFENKLQALKDCDLGEAVLSNMSDFPILRIARSGEKITTTISSTDSSGIGISSLTVSGYSSEIPQMLCKLRAFEKWW
jgi:hypothetical protein